MHITVETYIGLHEAIEYFQKGIYEILIIGGRAGTGKSQAVHNTFRAQKKDHEYLWLEGRTTAAVFYRLLWEYLDCPIIIDEANTFTEDKQCLNLLKTLCQTDQDKRVQWLTLRNLPEGMPDRFDTSSSVVLITNQWNTLNKHLSAIQDRGLYVDFAPTKQEVHSFAQQLCSLEVWQYFGMFLQAINNVSLRDYVIAERMHKSHLPWRKQVMHNWKLDPMQSLYLEIEITYPDLSDTEKKYKFIELGGKSHKAYDRVKKQLLGI